MRNAFIFLAAVFAALSFPARAQSAPEPANPKVLLPVLQSGGLIASLQWDADGATLDAIVTAEGDGARLRIYARGADGPHLLLSDGGGAQLVSLFTSCPSGCPLVTVWASGRNRRVAVFAWVAGDLRTALDVTAPAMPEFLTDPAGAEPLVLLKAVPAATSAAHARGFQAEIYRWNKGRYEKVKTAAWKDRLVAVAALK